MLGKNVKSFSHDRGCASQDSHWVPPVYKSEVLPLVPTLLVLMLEANGDELVECGDPHS
jgi:hypothetical protein